MAHRSLFIDLDGTLVDSRPGIFKCARATFDALGIEQPREEDLLPIIGPPLRNGFSRFLDSEELIDRAVEIYRAQYGAGGMFEAFVYPGIVESLESLDNDYILFCVTSKVNLYAEKIMAHFSLDRFFKKVYGPDLDGALSGKTELIRYALDTEKILRHNAVMIGDTHYDIEGARANNVCSVGVLWGFGSESSLREAGADIIIANQDEIVNAVEAICSISRCT